MFPLSTASSLTWKTLAATMMAGTMYMLCKHPAALRKLTESIRAEFSSPSEITLVKLQHQEYLNAVINEGLRLYPPAPDSLFRRTKAQSAVVAGHYIPPNTSVCINLLAAHRHPLNFHRPDELIPERWLKPCPPEFEKDDRGAVKPFSVGPRDCLGKKYVLPFLFYFLFSFACSAAADHFVTAWRGRKCA